MPPPYRLRMVSMTAASPLDHVGDSHDSEHRRLSDPVDAAKPRTLRYEPPFFLDMASRASPGSPLAGLPSSLDDRTSPTVSSSGSSSPGTFIRTPLTFADPAGDLPYPSPGTLAPMGPDSPAHPTGKHRSPALHIDADPLARRRSSARTDTSTDGSLPSTPVALCHRPVALRRMDQFLDIPPSPPIADPGLLLALPPQPDQSPNDHSIAAPFANLNAHRLSTSSSSSPDNTVNRSPLRASIARPRPSTCRRPSGLAHAFDTLAMGSDSAPVDDYAIDDDDADTIVRTDA